MIRTNLLPYRRVSLFGLTGWFIYGPAWWWLDNKGRPCDSQMGLMGEKGYSKETGRTVYTDDYPLYYIYGSAEERTAEDNKRYGPPSKDWNQLKASKTPLTKVCEEESLIDLKTIVSDTCLDFGGKGDREG